MIGPALIGPGHADVDTDNADDSIYDTGGLLTVLPTDTGYLAVIDPGIDG